MEDGHHIDIHRHNVVAMIEDTQALNFEWQNIGPRCWRVWGFAWVLVCIFQGSTQKDRWTPGIEGFQFSGCVCVRSQSCVPTTPVQQYGFCIIHQGLYYRSGLSVCMCPRSFRLKKKEQSTCSLSGLCKHN